MTRVKATHDFGLGQVPAHQHPNGGGWVAETATVEEKAFVGMDARVSGAALVSGDAQVSGDARVSAPRDLLVIGPIGSRNDYTTATFRPTVLVTTGCFEAGTFADFVGAVAQKDPNDPHRREYEALIALIDLREKGAQS